MDVGFVRRLRKRDNFLTPFYPPFYCVRGKGVKRRAEKEREQESERKSARVYWFIANLIIPNLFVPTGSLFLLVLTI
jgi:hypothetical protein